MSRDVEMEDEPLRCVFPKKYNKILGGGGFGDVYGSTLDKSSVVKAVRKKKVCVDTEKEFSIHEKIHKNVVKVNDDFLNVPEPRGFCYLESNKYECIYEMERVFSVRKDGMMLQLTFNSDSATLNNVDRVVGRYYGRDIGIDNPPRGFYRSLRKFLNLYGSDPTENVTFAMGKMNAIITIISGYDGRDVEYVLTKTTGNGKYKVQLTVIDFGLCQPLTGTAIRVAQKINDINEIDIYFPSVSDDLGYALISLLGFVRMCRRSRLTNVQTEIVKEYYTIIINRARNEIMMDNLKHFLGSHFMNSQTLYIRREEEVLAAIFRLKDIRLSYVRSGPKIMEDLMTPNLDSTTANWRMRNLDFKILKAITSEFRKNISDYFVDVCGIFNENATDLHDYITKNAFI